MEMTDREKIANLERENHALRRELSRLERRFADLQRLSASQAEALDRMEAGTL